MTLSGLLKMKLLENTTKSFLLFYIDIFFVWETQKQHVKNRRVPRPVGFYLLNI